VTRSHDRGLSEGLIGQIRLCEQLLNRTCTPEDRLSAMTTQELQQMAAQLRQELTS
jgi:hypothetical protein